MELGAQSAYKKSLGQEHCNWGSNWWGLLQLTILLIDTFGLSKCVKEKKQQRQYWSSPPTWKPLENFMLLSQSNEHSTQAFNSPEVTMSNIFICFIVVWYFSSGADEIVTSSFPKKERQLNLLIYMDKTT